MFRLSSLSCELRRCLAGALLSLPLAAFASAPQETFLPPQTIPLPGTMTFSKLVVADVNGDHYDDIVAIGLDSDGPVIDIYLNEGKPRSSAQDVTFIKQRLILKGHTNTDASIDNVKFSNGFDLQVVDLDNDGKPDILASDAASGEIFVLWNQGTNAPAPFVFVPDTSDPTAPSMTFFSQLATRGSFGPVLGTPIYVTAADLKDGSGRKSIVAYHGGLQLDSSTAEHAPFNRRNYESMAIIYPLGSGRAFDIVKQRDAWPDCDLAFGSTAPACAGWADGMTPNTSLYNFRISDENGRSNLGFADAASDILSIDGWQDKGTPQQAYVVGTYRPNASPGLQVLAGHGANGSDSVWLQGGGQVHEFVADNTLALMRQRTAIDTAITTAISTTVSVKERSAGATFGALSSGATALITGGGMRVVYDPSNAGSAVDQLVPEYLRRDGQIGGWLGWASLGSGSALLSLSDYCRAPDPCASQLSWYHKPLSGDPSPAMHWGGAHTLVMLDFARETTTPSGTQFEPFFQQPDDARFQAFSIMGGSINHKPFIAAGHFASPSESALVILDHSDGAMTDPMWNHLVLYRPDTSKTYRSPVPHVDGFAIGEYISDHMVEKVGSFQQGTKSLTLLGSAFGTDQPDVIRYVTVRDAATHAMQGIFPVDPPEVVKEIGMSGTILEDGVVVPGFSTLALGKYEVQVHNANAVSDWTPISVGNPRGIISTDYDWLAGRTCGLVPNTKDGGLWPKQITVSVTGFSDAELQAVRWVKTDGAAVEVSATGFATFDATSKTITLTVPQGKLSDGSWRVFIKAADTWIKVQRSWNVASDSATLDACAAQVDFKNEEAYSQCTNDDYYLKAVDYTVWPNHADGAFRYFGSGFAQNRIRSVALKQSGHRYFSQSVDVLSDNEIHVNFGDLSEQLTPNVPLDLYFYSEAGDVVQANGVSAAGGKQSWRTVRNGDCHQSMPQFTTVGGGSGKDGAFQAGDVISATGKNLMYPVPTANRLILTDQNSGAKYALPPRLPEDFYTRHYDNDAGKLLFVIPNDDEWENFKIADGDGLLESWAPPPYVSYVIEAGTTAATEASVSAWAAGSGVLGGFTAGIYLSGNTPTGVLNWIASKIGIDAKPAPGTAGDDQPRNDGMYVVTYMSNDGMTRDANIYTAVFRSDPGNLLSNAKQAIYYQGRGTYSNSRNIGLWPCTYEYGFPIYGCMLTISAFASNDPNGISIPQKWGTWNLMWLPERFFVGESQSMAIGVGDIRSLIPYPPGADLQFSWRAGPVPLNYDWIQTGMQSRMITTDASNDCTKLWSTNQSVCFQKPMLQ